ncbi:MAG: DUF2752 domain-containing protein [Edaphobacter sp.]|uniref:DUF2752 domain-containing protein n=1 Tax=Edaphobacter sp. TaxID=1934404 RepID=UPI00238D4814|nr:DUF2752 domain-containing protein [Edaphobacter sp.]MDE1177012.1 DUF2752 domain-containing protein [Edaphobacter sp.]
MHSTQRSRPVSLALAAAPALLALCIAALLLRFPPDRYSFYPRCPIHDLFGILCPGCGTTRALAALLHGHLHEALQLNALTTLLMPLAIAYALTACLRLLQRKPISLPQPPAPAIYATLTAAALFTVARNL